MDRKISLAPIRGLTNASFRSLFARHFSGIDCTIAPFINPQKKANFNAKMLRDVLPENNCELPVIPQLLHTDPEDFLALAQRLADLGYSEINWNLGCPAPMVTRKKRGSGMLSHPEMILAFLEEVIPKLPVALSIKTRLGFENNEETAQLIPLLDQFPLTEIIVHARIGRQIYKGRTDPECFKKLQELSKHTLAYNGDVNSVAIYQELQKRLPTTAHWMLGRGLLADPFLAERISGNENSTDERGRIRAFHSELVDLYRSELSGESHVVGRLKMLWQYLGNSFAEEKKALKKIQRSSTEKQILHHIDSIL